jgi:type I restriction enzyme S subunit
MSTGSAAISKLTLNPPKFLFLNLPMPGLEEQARIACRIEHFVHKIGEIHDIREQSIEETKSILRSVLRQLSITLPISGTLSDVLIEPPRNGWSAKCDNASDGTPVLGLGAVTGFRYRGSEFKRTSLPAAADGHFWLKPDDLLITRSNTPELVGHAAIYDGKPSPCIYPDLMMRIRLNETVTDKRFVWYWLQSPAVRDFIMRNAKGTSSTMKKISQGTVMRIPFPTKISLSKQLEIVKELDAVQAGVDSLRKLQGESALSADALIPSIIEHAFTGQL